MLYYLSEKGIIECKIFMNITILTGVFYPQVHPRAFRAAELAKEFVRIGHKVKVVNLKTVVGFDYDTYAKENNIEIVNLNVFVPNNINAQKSTYTPKGKVIRFLIEYFLCGRLFWYGKDMVDKLVCLKGADLVIALSTPFPVHYGFAKYIKKYGRDFIAIADSGDPFYYSKQGKRAFYFKYLEKDIYKQIDYLTIPTQNAIPLYNKLIPSSKIHIIPQGFNMNNIKLYDGIFENPVKFAYAGVFYWDIRNPEFLFKYLDSLNTLFEFYIFMRYEDAKFNEMMDKYENLRGKVKIAYNVPHDDLILELSKMHFLINIENVSNTQMPSKLIDYGMTKRPIYSCSESNFEPNSLIDFLNGNYGKRYHVDIEEYRIENVASKFLSLVQKNNV